MKTIISPTDFSKASKNALMFASELARRSGCDLIVVHVKDKAADTSEFSKKLNQIIKELGDGISCEAKIVTGSLPTALKKITESLDECLVVMGTKGVSGLKRILVGSNTVHVLSKTKAPVLVIPEKATFEKFMKRGKNRVVLATDLDELRSMSVLKILKEIALLIEKPKVRVLNIRPRNTGLTYLPQLERSALMHFFNPEIESEKATVFATNIMGGIRYYLDGHKDTGLVAMVARESKSIFERHYTREMASHGNYPLLVLPDIKKKKQAIHNS